MKQIAKDLMTFMNSLTVNDLIFFSAILSLVILVVTMIYLIRINAEEGISFIKKNEKDDYLDEVEDDFSNELLSELSSETSKEEDILPRAEDEPDTLLDLAALTKKLENLDTESNIDLRKYEEEQEEKAIISYDELVKNKSAVKINYTEETEDEGLLVKKVDLENLTSIDDTYEAKIPKVSLVAYDKEEAFLQALKDLNKLLS